MVEVECARGYARGEWRGRRGAKSARAQIAGGKTCPAIASCPARAQLARGGLVARFRGGNPL
eukprot:3483144-Pyramimonas_sp.AAC.1